MANKESLERLLCMAKKGCKVDMCNVKYVENATDIIKKDLYRLEKLEKALEIIKNKCAANTNIWLVVCTRTYEDYESFVENKDHKLVRLEHNILTQQEYELLKEVLEDE